MSKTVSSLAKISLVVVVFTILLPNTTLSEQKICGKAIDDVLRLMCVNGTRPHEMKRNSMIEEDFEENNKDEENNFALSYDMIQQWVKMEAESLAKIRRRRVGIYHECCLKPCTTAELKSYCLPTS